MRRKSSQGAGSASGTPGPSWHAELPDSAASVQQSVHRPLVGVATFAGPVLFFNPVTGAVAHQSAGHPGGALAIAFSPSSSLVATGGQDGRLHLFNPGEQGPSLQIRAGKDPVSHLAWSPRGDVVAAACGRTVRFYSPTGDLLGECADHASTVTSLGYHDAGEGWLSACYGGVFLLSRATLQRERCFFARTSVLVAASSPCGRYIAAGAQDPVVRLWDLEGPDEPVHLEGYKGKVASLAWSAESTVLATASGASVVLWSFAGGNAHEAPHVELAGHTRRVSAVRFLQQRRALWTASADGHLRLFDLMKSTAPALEIDTGAPVSVIEPSSAGDGVLAAGTDGSLRAWSHSFAAEVAPKRRKRTRAEGHPSS